MNKTHINDHGHLTVELTSGRPVTMADRSVVAKFVAQRMYGGAGKVPEGIPYSDYPEKHFWVMDQHNDWFLKFSDTGATITVWHRNPQERHMLIIGALDHALEKMLLVLLPSQLADNGPDKHIGSDTPAYRHHCEKCDFMGKWKGEGIKGPATIYDLYYCEANMSGPTILARYGDWEGDYSSGMIFGQEGIDPALTEAYRRLQQRTHTH